MGSLGLLTLETHLLSEGRDPRAAARESYGGSGVFVLGVFSPCAACSDKVLAYFPGGAFFIADRAVFALELLLLEAPDLREGEIERRRRSS